MTGGKGGTLPKLNEAPNREGTWGNTDIALRILNSATEEGGC
jgi:hypothetical protein